VESIKKYKKIGAKIILMSANKRSTLGRLATVFIHIPDKKQIIEDNPTFAQKVKACNNWELLGSLSETIAHIILNEFIGEWGYSYQREEIDFDREHQTKQ
jgi:D-arabinose 5-phosphate isomerase GutQ